ncbi:hypothetical protein ACERII_06810 [Evansella sp. AB-rgal1]|uniref:hypothetical protein n=1 Tax=Evansella sp. AB-rgal1 TaxID=3242696 RepID=UPI00359E63A2
MKDTLSYVEKLENLFVLLETRSMLKDTLSSYDDEGLKEDLRKIEQEIRSYSTGLSCEELEEKISISLFTPTILEETQHTTNFKYE